MRHNGVGKHDCLVVAVALACAANAIYKEEAAHPPDSSEPCSEWAAKATRQSKQEDRFTVFSVVKCKR